MFKVNNRTLDIFHNFFFCFYCWLWLDKGLLGYLLLIRNIILRRQNWAVKQAERCRWRHNDVSFLNFEQNQSFNLVFFISALTFCLLALLILNLNKIFKNALCGFCRQLLSHMLNKPYSGSPPLHFPCFQKSPNEGQGRWKGI